MFNFTILLKIYRNLNNASAAKAHDASMNQGGFSTHGSGVKNTVVLSLSSFGREEWPTRTVVDEVLVQFVRWCYEFRAAAWRVNMSCRVRTVYNDQTVAKKSSFFEAETKNDSMIQRPMAKWKKRQASLRIRRTATENYLYNWMQYLM